MMGTVSELDLSCGIGIIDADDGRLIFFNDSNLRPASLDAIRVGARVLFEEHEEDWGSHADVVFLSP